MKDTFLKSFSQNQPAPQQAVANEWTVYQRVASGNFATVRKAIELVVSYGYPPPKNRSDLAKNLTCLGYNMREGVLRQ